MRERQGKHLIVHRYVSATGRQRVRIKHNAEGVSEFGPKKQNAEGVSKFKRRVASTLGLLSKRVQTLKALALFMPFWRLTEMLVSEPPRTWF